MHIRWDPRLGTVAQRRSCVTVPPRGQATQSVGAPTQPAIVRPLVAERIENSIAAETQPAAHRAMRNTPVGEARAYADRACRGARRVLSFVAVSPAISPDKTNTASTAITRALRGLLAPTSRRHCPRRPRWADRA
jgi:hypothetical protein